MAATKRAQPPETNGWMTSQEAADYLSVSHGYLRNMRSCGGGPAYHKANGIVRYRQADLDAWLMGRAK